MSRLAITGWSGVLAFAACHSSNPIDKGIATMDELKARVCACKDAGCVVNVRGDRAKWFEDVAKTYDRSVKPTVNQSKRIDELNAAFEACADKLDRTRTETVAAVADGLDPALCSRASPSWPRRCAPAVTARGERATAEAVPILKAMEQDATKYALRTGPTLGSSAHIMARFLECSVRVAKLDADAMPAEADDDLVGGTVGGGLGGTTAFGPDGVPDGGHDRSDMPAACAAYTRSVEQFLLGDQVPAAARQAMMDAYLAMLPSFQNGTTLPADARHAMEAGCDAARSAIIQTAAAMKCPL